MRSLPPCPYIHGPAFAFLGIHPRDRHSLSHLPSPAAVTMSDKENDILDPFQIPDEDEQPASSAKDQEQPKEQRPSASTSLSSSSREHTPIASLKDDFTNHFAISDPDPSDDADADADADKAALGGGSSDDLPSSSPFAQSNNNGQAESSDKSGDQQTQPARQTTAYPPSVITVS